jgi:hypothetical protein
MYVTRSSRLNLIAWIHLPWFDERQEGLLGPSLPSIITADGVTGAKMSRTGYKFSRSLLHGLGHGAISILSLHTYANEHRAGVVTSLLQNTPVTG